MSFAMDTKNYLCRLNIKQNCCKRSLLYGMLAFSGVFTHVRVKLITENESTAELFSGLLKSLVNVDVNEYISEKKLRSEDINSYKLTVSAKKSCGAIYDYLGLHDEEPGSGDKTAETIGTINEEIFTCKSCVGCFLRGAFLTGGSVSDPEKSYHLDIRATTEEQSLSLCTLLESVGIPAKCSHRVGNPTVYLKGSENIQDFLTLIGAQKSALAVITEKIMKEVRNNENRKTNFETANLYKITGSAGEQIKAIEELMENGGFSEMPDELKYTARLRLENPFSSLSELVSMHDVPITKSGLNHRLSKIVAFCSEYSKKE